jgi:hypothetical protein
MKKCICFFMSRGISHWPSYWPSSNLTIPTNQCLFMSHEEMHFPFYVIGKCMWKSPIGILITNLPFSHFNQSMFLHVTWRNAFTFSSHEEMHGIPFGLFRSQIWATWNEWYLNSRLCWPIRFFTIKFFLLIIFCKTFKRFFGMFYHFEPWRWSHWVNGTRDMKRHINLTFVVMGMKITKSTWFFKPKQEQKQT